MFDINQVYKVENFLDDIERSAFDYFCDHYVWEMEGYSHTSTKLFWKKDLWESKWGQCEPIETTFRRKIESLLNVKLQTLRMYLNGQAHGQCGSMHSDMLGDEDPEYQYITAVYYVNKEWNAEYGGFTVIIDKSDNMHIVYPKPNSIVIFDSSLPHVGLEPTCHCNDQRVTLAHKFKILKD